MQKYNYLVIHWSVKQEQPVNVSFLLSKKTDVFLWKKCYILLYAVYKSVPKVICCIASLKMPHE